MKPVIKWVGSKRREAPVIAPFIAERLNSSGALYEIFSGGASIFWHMKPKRAVLNDILPDITNLYMTLQIDPVRVWRSMNALVEIGICEKSYMRVRAMSPVGMFDTAGRLLYLNRTCFNGLYRTNGSGRFNVPYGKYKKPSFPACRDLRIAGRVLRRSAVVMNRSWTVALLTAGEGDVVFADPPFFGTFQGYAGKESQVDDGPLCTQLRGAHERGCHVVATVPTTDKWRKIAEPWMDEHPLPRVTTVGQSTSQQIVQSLWVTRL